MKPIRILHFIDSLAAGGAERQLVYLLQELDRGLFESSVVTIYDTFQHYEATLRSLNIPMYSLHHGDLQPRNRMRALYTYIKLMWRFQPDIVHSWLHYPNLMARIARPFCPPHKLVTSIRSKYSVRQQMSENATFWLSDFRIVNHKSSIYPNTSPKTRTQHIPNAVITLYPPKIELQSTEHPPQYQQFLNATFRTLMVGRIDPSKDHKTLLLAINTIRDRLPEHFKLLLIGEVTSPGTQKQIEHLINKLDLTPFVIQAPPTHEIGAYYTITDITILPSVSEGFPNVILESFAAGKPILCSDAANADDIVQHSVNGWIFTAGDADALAHQLTVAVNTPKTVRQAMGEHGRQSNSKYAIEAMIEQYCSVYLSLVRRS